MLVRPRISSWPLNQGRGSPSQGPFVLLVPISVLDDLQTRSREPSPLAIIDDLANYDLHLWRFNYELPFLMELRSQRTRPSSLNAEPPSREADSVTNPPLETSHTPTNSQQTSGRVADDASVILANTGFAFMGQPRHANFMLALPDGMRTPSTYSSSLSLSSGHRSGLFTRAQSMTPSISRAATGLSLPRVFHTIGELFQDQAGSSSRLSSEGPGSLWNQNIGADHTDIHDPVNQIIQPPTPVSESVRPEAAASDQDDIQRAGPSKGKKRKRFRLDQQQKEDDDTDDDKVCPDCKRRKSEHGRANAPDESDEDEDGIAL